MTRKPFTGVTPKSRKLESTRTDIWSTPLALRTRIPLDEVSRNEIRRRLGRKLANFAAHIDRVSLRIEDANGPRGGVDIICRLKVVLRALPSVVVEERGADVLFTLGRVAEATARAVRRTLQRSGWSLPRGAGEATKGTPARTAISGRLDDEGSIIGRRVGQGSKNLERALARPEKDRRNVYVDTAAPGTSASDRRVGYGATATRNTKRNTAGMAAALEDSRTTPSRKSTRKSKNRAKSGTLLERKAQLKLQSPKTRATRTRTRRD